MPKKNQSNTYIYHTELSTFSATQFDLLNEEDKEHAKQRKNPKRFQTFVSGRSLLAKALQMLTGDASYQLDYNALGKPLLKQPVGWFFNITHSDNHIFLVIQNTSDIGIDSEIMKPRNFQHIAKKIFTPKDYQSILNAPSPLVSFYQLWTQHEAQVKQLGLSVFSTVPKNSLPYLYSYQLDDSILSICSHHPITTPLFYQYNGKKDCLKQSTLKPL